MLIRELAAMIHQNAVDHGWWEVVRELPEIVALIHSEWSDALEEARAGRPMVWFAPDDNFECCARNKCGAKMAGRMCYGPRHADMPRDYCPAHKKPEGVAVELIDGCIRILDALGYSKADIMDPDTGEPAQFEELMGKYRAVPLEEMPEDVPTLIARLHAFTSQTMLEEDESAVREVNLIAAMSLALSWVQAQGIDPLALLLEKHEYNKGRPYKHGKRF